MSCRILGEKIANDANGVGAVVPPFLHFFQMGWERICPPFAARKSDRSSKHDRSPELIKQQASEGSALLIRITGVRS